MRQRMIDQGLALLSKRAVQRIMVEKCLTPSETRVGVMSEDTWQKLLNEDEPLQLRIVHKLVKKLGCEHRDILHPRSLEELYGALEQHAESLKDWIVCLPLGGQRRAANGLKYVSWELKHRFDSDRTARGKQYDLTELPTDEQTERSTYLSRHSEICRKMTRECRQNGGIQFFPAHVTTIPDAHDETWWSIDEWSTGEDLGVLLETGADLTACVAPIMKNIVEGLRILHRMGVIYRELSPGAVVVTDRTAGEIVLTDFELGKLLDGSPTVSDDWPTSPYRAPEVEDRELTPSDLHVDLYSWARMVTRAVCDGLPQRGEEASWLDAAKLPPKTLEIVKRCLDDDPTRRPQSADEVARSISHWR